MESAEFQKIVEARVGKCLGTLTVKATEYTKGDRLHNFKKAAEVLRTTKEKALLGFATKHLISVIDIVEDLERGVWVTGPVWDEKIGDLINYLLLLDACWHDRPPLTKENV